MEETTLFNKKYRIPSTRKPGWDYQTDGYYFVTICTYMRQPFFGEIKNKKMIRSDMGQICHDEWVKTTTIRKNITLDAFIIMPDHAHFLVVIKNDGDDGYNIDERNNVSRGNDGRNIDERNNVSRGDDERNIDERNNVSRRDEAEPRLYTTGISMNNAPSPTIGISTSNAPSQITNIPPNTTTTDDWITIHNQNQPISHFQRISPKPKSLPTIIGAYKSFCTRRIRNLGYTNFMWQDRYHDSIIKDKEGVFRVREYIKNNPKKWRK